MAWHYNADGRSSGKAPPLSIRSNATLNRLARHLGALVLPQDCLLCGDGADSLLCAACSASLPRLPPELCPVCALPTPGGVNCGACQARPPHFDATSAAFRYGYPLDRLIQALKYQHRLALAAWFARTMLQTPPPGRHDLLLALPLASKRLSERGFNQALEIARPLAHALALPLALDVCIRRGDASPQASLPWRARQRNVRGVFEAQRDLSGKSVLVIDDVMTTGASLNELARSLKKQGAVRVGNWVLARTIRGD